MTKRTAKQILYGTGYLAVLFLIIFIIYLFWFKAAATCFDNEQNQAETGIDCGGPCLPCEIKNLSPFEFSQIKFFPADGQTVITAEIKNPNFNYGADSFTYTLEIYGTGGAKIKTLTKSSFIYASEIKYLLELVETSPQNISDIKISFSNPNWKPAKEFSKPEIQLREIKIESTTPDKGGVVISGVMANTNAFSLSKARIIAFLFNQVGVQISASKTELENISAFEEKTFKINFPKNISLMAASATPQANAAKADPTKTKFYAEAIR